MKNDAAPPRLALRLLDRFSGWEDDYGAAGDFEEYYRALAAERGIRHARRVCWRQVRAAFPGYLKNVIIWSDAMLKHYSRIALRNLMKHKGYSFINIAGLAVGMACALFILLLVQNELSYDRFHARAKTLYRLEQESDDGQGRFRHSSMPYTLGPILKAEIPEVQETIRIADQAGLFVRCGEKSFFENNVAAVDPQILQMFTFPLLLGDPATALSRPGSLVVTEDTAKKYFGSSSPMGRTLTFNEAYDFTVTGVLENIPLNSTLSFDMLVPFDFTKTLGQYHEGLLGNDISTYIQLHPQSDVVAAGRKITRLVADRIQSEIRGPEIRKYLEGHPDLSRQIEARNKSRIFILMPLVDINLYGHSMAIKNVFIYSALALLILLIACINFMNLATARSAGRAKEIGLRKVVGAQRKSLVGQFYGESILTTLLAGTLSFILVILLFPAFKTLSGKMMTSDVLWRGNFLVGMLAITLLTGLVAGSYPALLLSSFEPVKTIKGRRGDGAGTVLFRKTLVIFQFGLSVLFLVCMGGVSRQVDFMRHKKLGYDKEQLIYLPLRDKAALSYAALKERLLRNPRILGVSAARHPPTSIYASDTVADWDGRDPETHFRISFASVDFDFPETMKIEMAAGRSFSRDFPSDVRQAFLVNEEIPKLMGVDAAAAVGRRFGLRGYEGPIVGVMKNFHFKTVHEAIEPLAVVLDPEEFRYAVVRLTPGEIPASLEDVRESWRQAFPQYPLEYRFFDEDFDQMYRKDERMGMILKVFSVLALFIAGLGLFGLASYTALQRTKEIGVRKVLGASPSGIVGLLSKEFAKWVLLANLLAWPIAYLLMKNWLRGFAYSAGIVWWQFAAAGIGTLAIALATVSFQAVRASRIDPAITLKYE
jgi:putative ABC transport system permease protein